MLFIHGFNENSESAMRRAIGALDNTFGLINRNAGPLVLFNWHSIAGKHLSDWCCGSEFFYVNDRFNVRTSPAVPELSCVIGNLTSKVGGVVVRRCDAGFFTTPHPH